MDTGSYLLTLANAQAQTRAGRWAAAAALWQQIVEQNPIHGGHWEQLARARFAVADFRGALAAYERAGELGVWAGSLTLNIFPGDIAYRIACCQVRLANQPAAVAALDRAVRLGFRDLDQPRADPHWAPLLADPRVRDLLGIIDTGQLSRHEGWRLDIAFLLREIKRRAAGPLRAGVDRELDAAAARLAREVPALSDAQIIAGMLRMLVPLGDGHAFVAPSQDDSELNQILPVKFYLFREGLHVTAAAPQYRQLLGALVLAVGEHRVADVLATLEPLISRDNTQQVAWLGPEVLVWQPMLHALGLADDPRIGRLTVTLPDGRTDVVAVETVPAPVPRDYPTVAPSAAPNRPCPAGWISLPAVLAEHRPENRPDLAGRAAGDPAPGVPLYLRRCDELYWFEYLRAERLVYFQLNGVGDQPGETLAACCDRLFEFIKQHPVAALVIDLRWNGGGNTPASQPLLHHLIGCPTVNRPGGLYVIIGRGTFSAAQNTATAIERETHAIFVGEPSGSRPNFIGETSTFELPVSRVIANVSDLYWQTSWPVDYRTWIAPELYTPPTFAAYRQNRDPAMEAILASRQVPPAVA